MNCKLGESSISNVFTFGDVWLKVSHIVLVKRNLNQEVSLAILLDTLKNPRVTSFLIPLPKQFFKQEKPYSLMKFSLGTKIRVETLIFVEE